MAIREKITVLAQTRAVSDDVIVADSVCKSSSYTFPGDSGQRSPAFGWASTPFLYVHVVASREALDMKPRSPEKSVGVADAKCWSSMRKWQRCTFLHSMWSSLSLLRNKHLLQGSRLKTVFFEQGTETRTHPQGMGVLLYVRPGLAISFPVHLSFIILPHLASKSVYCILLPRLCLQKLSNREQMRECSNSRLRCLTTLRVHVFTEFAYTDALNYAKAPSSHRGVGGRLRCLRLLVASFGGIHLERQSNELPATTVGECRRRHSLRRHKGGRWTV